MKNIVNNKSVLDITSDIIKYEKKAEALCNDVYLIYAKDLFDCRRCIGADCTDCRCCSGRNWLIIETRYENKRLVLNDRSFLCGMKPCLLNWSEVKICDMEFNKTCANI